MNRIGRLASRIVRGFLSYRVARRFVGIEFPTQDALDQYRKEHDVRKDTKLVVRDKNRSTSPKDQDSKDSKPKDEQKGKSDSTTEKKEQPTEYKHHRSLSSKELKTTLSKGHFSIVSAGRNPNDKKEAKMRPDDEFFHKRHQDLQDMLEELGFDYTEAVGHYGSKEPSFLIFHDDTRLTPKTAKSMMVHHANSDELSSRKEALNELGKVLNQDSVLHGDAGKNKISFTSGKNAGKECGGKGWKETPKAKDFYTDIKLDEGKHTKFALNVEECFKKGFFSSVGLEMRVLRIADRVARFL